MNCKINLLDLGIFTKVVYALSSEFTVVRGCMRQNHASGSQENVDSDISNLSL